MASPKTANNKPKKPLATSPKLKSGPVTPDITPRSLNALLVQLKAGYDTIAIIIQLKATMGAAIPNADPIFRYLICIGFDIISI
jgi:hypothetical protein